MNADSQGINNMGISKSDMNVPPTVSTDNHQATGFSKSNVHISQKDSEDDIEKGPPVWTTVL